MAFKFPRSKRNNDGTYGPTSRNHYYLPVSYHARTSLKRSSKSRWCLREAEQFYVFRIADEPWWECVLNHCLFSIVDFGNIILGENGERLAVFPIPRNPNPDEPEPNRKKLFVSGFYESPGSKTKGLNPGDSANPDTTIKSLLFLHRFNFKVTNDYWHGYPIQTEESKPGPNLLDRWEEDGIITPHLRRKIEAGRL